MKLTKEQQELLRVIAFDINCISMSNTEFDNIYHIGLARDNINILVKDLGIKVIPEGD